MSKIEVKLTLDKFRGVFATAPIEEGETIEICPTIVLSAIEDQFLRDGSDRLKYYALELVELGQQVLPLGYGMLYNHSTEPNAEIVLEDHAYSIRFRALKAIQPGDEIVYDYEFDGPEELPVLY